MRASEQKRGVKNRNGKDRERERDRERQRQTAGRKGEPDSEVGVWGQATLIPASRRAGSPLRRD